ncbi:MAG TPA: hypothetical protein VII65_01785 [Acidimicrobiales bacterium]
MTIAGVVGAFSELRGDGVIVSDAGESLYFHCVSILDGSRTIDVGTEVVGNRRVGHLGSDEVDAVGPLS